MLSTHMAFFLYPLYLHWYAAEFLGRGYLEPLPLMHWKKCILWLHSPSQIHLTFSFRSSNPFLIWESHGLLWLLTCHHHSSHSQVLSIRLISLIWGTGSYMYVQQVKWCFPDACSWAVHFKNHTVISVSKPWVTAYTKHCSCNLLHRKYDPIFRKTEILPFLACLSTNYSLKVLNVWTVQVTLGKKQHEKCLYFASETDRCIGLKLPKDNFRSTQRVRTWHPTSSTLTVGAKTMVR